MAQISRVSRFSKGQDISQDQLESEITNIITNWNNHDQGTFTWGNVKVTTLSPQANIAMGGFKLTGLGAGTGNGDSLRYEQLIGLYLLLTGGTMSGAIAMGTNKITGLGNGTTAQDAAAFGQVKVLQMVTSNTTTVTSTTSSTFQATSLTANITPASASNRILIMVSGQLEMDTSGISSFATIQRGSTNLGGSSGFMTTRANATGLAANQESASAIYVDSPATTTATTYAVYLRNSDNVTSCSWGVASMTQSIVLMEIV